jgi:hypothetical protein
VQRHAVFRLGGRRIPAPAVQQAEIGRRFRAVGIDQLRGNELLGAIDKGGLQRRRQRQQVGSGQCPRGFDADRPNRIGSSEAIARSVVACDADGVSARSAAKRRSGSAMAAVNTGSVATEA